MEHIATITDRVLDDVADEMNRRRLRDACVRAVDAALSEVWIVERRKPASWTWMMRKMQPGEAFHVRLDHRRAVMNATYLVNAERQFGTFEAKTDRAGRFVTVRRVA